MHLGPYDLVLLGVAAFRLGRLTSFDKVAEPLRRPFTETVLDDTGAGETVEPRGSGVQRAIGEVLNAFTEALSWTGQAARNLSGNNN